MPSGLDRGGGVFLGVECAILTRSLRQIVPAHTGRDAQTMWLTTFQSGVFRWRLSIGSGTRREISR